MWRRGLATVWAFGRKLKVKEHVHHVFGVCLLAGALFRSTSVIATLYLAAFLGGIVHSFTLRSVWVLMLLVSILAIAGHCVVAGLPQHEADFWFQLCGLHLTPFNVVIDACILLCTGCLLYLQRHVPKLRVRPLLRREVSGVRMLAFIFAKFPALYSFLMRLDLYETIHGLFVFFSEVIIGLCLFIAAFASRGALGALYYLLIISRLVVWVFWTARPVQKASQDVFASMEGALTARKPSIPSTSAEPTYRTMESEPDDTEVRAPSSADPGIPQSTEVMPDATNTIGTADAIDPAAQRPSANLPVPPNPASNMALPHQPLLSKAMVIGLLIYSGSVLLFLYVNNPKDSIALNFIHSHVYQYSVFRDFEIVGVIGTYLGFFVMPGTTKDWLGYVFIIAQICLFLSLTKMLSFYASYQVEPLRSSGVVPVVVHILRSELVATSIAMFWAISYPSYTSLGLFSLAMLALATHGLDANEFWLGQSWLLSIMTVYGVVYALVEYFLLLPAISSIFDNYFTTLEYATIDLVIQNAAMVLLCLCQRARLRYPRHPTAVNTSNNPNEEFKPAPLSFLDDQLNAYYINVRLWFRDAKIIVISHVDTMVLFTIYVVVLSTSVNLFQTGSLILATYLSLFQQHRRRLWRVLLLYTLATCLTLYTWNISCPQSTPLYELIGLTCYRNAKINENPITPLTTLPTAAPATTTAISYFSTVKPTTTLTPTTTAKPAEAKAPNSTTNTTTGTAPTKAVETTKKPSTTRRSNGDSNALDGQITIAPTTTKASTTTKAPTTTSRFDSDALDMLGGAQAIQSSTAVSKDEVDPLISAAAMAQSAQNVIRAPSLTSLWSSSLFDAQLVLIAQVILQLIIYVRNWHVRDVSQTKEKQPIYYISRITMEMDRLFRIGGVVLNYFIIIVLAFNWEIRRDSATFVGFLQLILFCALLDSHITNLVLFPRGTNHYRKLWRLVLIIELAVLLFRYLYQFDPIYDAIHASWTTDFCTMEDIGFQKLSSKTHLSNLFAYLFPTCFMAGLAAWQVSSMDKPVHIYTTKYDKQLAWICRGISHGSASIICLAVILATSKVTFMGFLYYLSGVLAVLQRNYKVAWPYLFSTSGAMLLCMYFLQLNLPWFDSEVASQTFPWLGLSRLTEYDNLWNLNWTPLLMLSLCGLQRFGTLMASEPIPDPPLWEIYLKYIQPLLTQDAYVTIVMLMLLISSFVHLNVISVVYMIILRYVMLANWNDPKVHAFYVRILTVVLVIIPTSQYLLILWFPEWLIPPFATLRPSQWLDPSYQYWLMLQSQNRWSILTDFLTLFAVYLVPTPIPASQDGTQASQTSVSHKIFKLSSLQVFMAKYSICFVLVWVFVTGCAQFGVASGLYLGWAIYMLFHLDRLDWQPALLGSLQTYNWFYLFLLLVYQCPWFNDITKSCTLGTNQPDNGGVCLSLPVALGLYKISHGSQVNSSDQHTSTILSIAIFIMIAMQVHVFASSPYRIVLENNRAELERCQKRGFVLNHNLAKMRITQWRLLKQEKQAAIQRLKVIVSKLVNKVEEMMDIAMGLHYSLPPMAPHRPVVLNQTQNSVTITWGAPESKIHRIRCYRISRQVFPSLTLLGDFGDVVEVPASKTTFEIKGLRPGTSYQFKVAAVSRMGEGPFSAPSEPAATIKLDWGDSCTAGWMKAHKTYDGQRSFVNYIERLFPWFVTATYSQRYAIVDADSLTLYKSEILALKYRRDNTKHRMKRRTTHNLKKLNGPPSYWLSEVQSMELSEHQLQLDEMSPLLYCIELVFVDKGSRVYFSLQPEEASQFDKWIISLLYVVPPQALGPRLLAYRQAQKLDIPDHILTHVLTPPAIGPPQSPKELESTPWLDPALKDAFYLHIYCFAYALQDATLQSETISYDEESDKLPSWSEFFLVLANVVRSQTAFLCYAAFVAAFSFQGDGLNLVYVLFMFAILLCENPRPQATLWKWVLKYSFFVVFIRYMFQLPFFCHHYTKSKSLYPSVQPYCPEAPLSSALLSQSQVQPIVLFGLYKFDGSANPLVDTTLKGLQWNFFVICCILFHRRELQLRGFWVYPRSRAMKWTETIWWKKIFSSRKLNLDSITPVTDLKPLNPMNPPDDTQVQEIEQTERLERRDSKDSLDEHDFELADYLAKSNEPSKPIIPPGLAPIPPPFPAPAPVTTAAPSPALVTVPVPTSPLEPSTSEQAIAETPSPQVVMDLNSHIERLLRDDQQLPNLNLSPLAPSFDHDDDNDSDEEHEKPSTIDELSEATMEAKESFDSEHDVHDSKGALTLAEPRFTREQQIKLVKKSRFQIWLGRHIPPWIQDYYATILPVPPQNWDKDIKSAVMGTKPGRDFILVAFGMNILILVYIIVFFHQFGVPRENSTLFSLSSTFQTSLLSGYMVGMIFFQVVIVVWDRVSFVYGSLYSKLLCHYFSLIMIHVMVWLVLPLHTGVYFQSNPYLVGLYLLQCVSMGIGANQIKYGYVVFRGNPYSLRQASTLSKYLFRIYMAIPFAFEVRTLLDYICSTTALDMRLWLVLEGIGAHLFLVKLQMEARIQGGYILQGNQRQPLYAKFQTAGLCFLALLLCLLAPMIMFSTANPTTINNPIIHASMTFGLLQPDGTFQQFYNSEENQSPETTKVVSSNSETYIQQVSFMEYSNDMWSSSPPLRRKLMASLNSTQRIKWSMTLTLKRTAPEGVQTVSYDIVQDITPAQRAKLAIMMDVSITQEFAYNSYNSAVLTIKNMYPPVINVAAATAPTMRGEYAYRNIQVNL
ncbi:hypothetical protein AC1031_002727 [Aphanomyces cochlioides]|nr:hypothetical protein AC1031_002727 [Aphanomyces cochlioides]